MNNSRIPGMLVRQGDLLVAANAPRGYWGELAEAEFDHLLGLLGENSNFDRTILDFFANHPRRDLYTYVTDVPGRSAWGNLLDDVRGDLAVDLGAGLGAIAESLSLRFANVFAVEGCRKRCDFLAHRRRLKGLSNLEIIHGDIVDLPIDSASVDLAVCNGGLEWVAVGRPGRVRPIQMAFLAEVARILKPEGLLYIGIENRFARQYLRGVPDHPGSRYTSFLPRWLATIAVRCQHVMPGFAVPNLGTSYRNYTYPARAIRRMLEASGLPYVSTVCVEPSYDIPRYAFNIRTGRPTLEPFFETFLNRPFRPFRDRALCNNYWIYASRQPLPLEPAAQPVLFGYFDTLSLHGSIIQRKQLAGALLREPLIRGTSILRRQALPQADDVASAFSAFLSGQTEPHPDVNLELVRDAMRTYLGGRLASKTIASLESAVAANHSGGRYHGDFWLGNLVFDDAAGRSVLIDQEPQIFGSPELDVADLAIDFYINRRSRPGSEHLPHQVAAILGIDLRNPGLLLAAVVRQCLRYTPAHRSHDLVYSYLGLLDELGRETVPSLLRPLIYD